MATEKGAIERASADLFLRLLNQERGTLYRVVEVSDAPDVKCEDGESRRTLGIEVTLLEQVEGEIASALGRDPRPDDYPREGHPDEALIRTLERKTEKDYGRRVALVVRQVSPPWDGDDWRRVFLVPLAPTPDHEKLLHARGLTNADFTREFYPTRARFEELTPKLKQRYDCGVWLLWVFKDDGLLELVAPSEFL